MLFRGDVPLTPEERADYEIGRTLRGLRDAGLVMEDIDSAGERVWSLTLRGVRDLNCSPEQARRDSGKSIQITSDVLDSSC